MKAKQFGFHTIEVALVVLVLGVLGFAGYQVVQKKQAKDQQTTTAQEVQAPQIKTADDLTTASNTVDQLDLSESSAELSVLEQELDTLE